MTKVIGSFYVMRDLLNMEGTIGLVMRVLYENSLFIKWLNKI